MTYVVISGRRLQVMAWNMEGGRRSGRVLKSTVSRMLGAAFGQGRWEGQWSHWPYRLRYSPKAMKCVGCGVVYLQRRPPWTHGCDRRLQTCEACGRVHARHRVYLECLKVNSSERCSLSPQTLPQEEVERVRKEWRHLFPELAEVKAR